MDDKKVTTVRLKPELAAALKQAAENTGVFQTRIIEDALKDHLASRYKIIMVNG